MSDCECKLERAGSPKGQQQVESKNMLASLHRPNGFVGRSFDRDPSSVYLRCIVNY
jgi:hypothetical protein